MEVVNAVISIIVGAVNFGINCFSKWRCRKIDKFKDCCESLERAKNNTTVFVYDKKSPIVGEAALIFLARKLCDESCKIDEEEIEKHYKQTSRNTSLRLSAMRNGKNPEDVYWEIAKKRVIKEAGQHPLTPEALKIPQELRQYQDAALRIVNATGNLRKKEQLECINRLRDTLTQVDLFWFFIFQITNGGDFKNFVSDLSLLKYMRLESLNLPQLMHLKLSALYERMDIPTRASERYTDSVSKK